MSTSTLEKLMKPAIIVICIAIFVGIHVAIPDFYCTIWSLTRAHNLDGLTAYISSFGGAAILVMILLIVLTNMTGLPSIQFLTINGILFGLVPGILLSWIGEVIGNVMAFLIMRYLFRDSARKLIDKHKAAAKIDTYSNFKMITLFRAIPYSPNLVITAICALSSVAFSTHLAATLLGKLPSVLIEVWLGHDLINFSQNGPRILLWIVLIVVLIGGWYYLHRRHAKTK